MTVTAQPIKNVSIYSASYTFNFTFRVIAETDLVVIHVDQSSTPVATTLVLNTDYSVSAGPWDSGGNISILAGYQGNLVSGDTVIVHRKMALAQLSDYIANAPFPAEPHEQTVDISRLIEQ